MIHIKMKDIDEGREKEHMKQKRTGINDKKSLVSHIALIGTLALILLLVSSSIASAATIGMSDRFHKQSRPVYEDSPYGYKKIAYKISFNQTYDITRLGFFPYSVAGNGGEYAAYLVSDQDDKPNMSDILTSNSSFIVSDVIFYLPGTRERAEVEVPQYTVQPDTVYWIVFEPVNATASNHTSFGLAQHPLVNFDFNYTTKYWNGSAWVDTGFYGVIWVKTTSGNVYGQLKIRRDTYAWIAGSKYAGQEVVVPSGGYTLDSFNIYMAYVTSPEDDLYLTIENLDNNSVIWNGSIGDGTSIPPGMYTYNFTEPKPVISNVSRIRFYLSSPNTINGSYAPNAIEFYNSTYSWHGENCYAVYSSNGGKSWSSSLTKDLQAHFVAHISTYYVSTSGNDSNNGTTPETAWRHIAYAAQQLQAGDTVIVEAGNYGNETITIANSGTASSPVTFKADGEVILETNYTSTKAISMTEKSYITIEGFIIKKYQHGIWFENCDHINVFNNTISETWGSGGMGIVCRYSNDCRIENNTVFNSGKYNFHIYHSTRITIKNNTAYNNWSLAKSDPDTTADYGFKFGYTTDSYSENNLAYNSGWHGWRLRHFTSNNTFKGDKAYNNGGYGFEINENCDNNTFINCEDDGNNSDYPAHKSLVGGGVGFAVYDKSDNNTFINCSVRNEDKGYDVRACWYDEDECGYNICANETTGECIGGYCNYESRNNKFINCTAENVNYGFRMYSPAGIMEECFVNNASVYDYHIEIGPDSKITNPSDQIFTIRLSNSTSSVIVKFTDGRTFKLDGDAGGHISVTLTGLGTHTIEVESAGKHKLPVAKPVCATGIAILIVITYWRYRRRRRRMRSGRLIVLVPGITGVWSSFIYN